MQTNDLGSLSNDLLPDFFGNKKPKAYGGNAIETFGDSLMPHEIFIGLIWEIKLKKNTVVFANIGHFGDLATDCPPIVLGYLVSSFWKIRFWT